MKQLVVITIAPYMCKTATSCQLAMLCVYHMKCNACINLPANVRVSLDATCD